jgi:hypothetical protein
MLRNHYSAILMAFVFFAGCGGGDDSVKPGVVVRGKLLKGGQPLSVPNQAVGAGMVQVALIPADKPGEPERALAKPDGTFQVVGSGKGLAAGRYKLAVFQRDHGMESDQLAGAFNEKSTPIIVELPASKVGGQVDLGDFDLDSYDKKK